MAQESACEADELTLADGVVGAAFYDWLLELAIQQRDEVMQTSDLEGLPYLLVRVLLKWIEIVAQIAHEELRLLWDDGELGAEILDANGTRVDSIDDYSTRHGLSEAIKSTEEASQRSNENNSANNRATVESPYVDLPEPVRPTIPMRSPALMEIEIYHKIDNS